MMKHTIKIISALALVAFLFAGCSDVFNGMLQTEVQGGSGSVRIQIGSDADARTLLPDTNQFIRYRLDFTKYGADPVIKEITNGNTVLDVELEPGFWNIRATGLVGTAGNLIDAVWGETNVTVEAGKAVSVNIILDTNAEDAHGVFKYSLEFPRLDGFGSRIADNYSTALLEISPLGALPGSEVNSRAITFNLLEQNVGNNSLTNNWQRLIQVERDGNIGWLFDGQLELHPGMYEMVITLTSRRTIQDGWDWYPAEVVRREIVYIYSNMVTATPEYQFTEMHFTDKLFFTGTASIFNQPTGRDYSPVEIQVAWTNYNSYDSFYTPSYIALDGEKLDGGGINDDGSWELYIKAKDIFNTNVNVSTNLSFRFVAKDGDLTVYSAWTSVPITNIQGRDWDINLTANIYNINASLALISPPAGTTITVRNHYGDDVTANAHFAAGTYAVFEVRPAAGRGLMLNTFSFNEQGWTVHPNYLYHDDTTIFFSHNMNGNLTLNGGTFYQVIDQDDIIATLVTNDSSWFSIPAGGRYFAINTVTGMVDRLSLTSTQQLTVYLNGNWIASPWTSQYDIPANAEGVITIHVDNWWNINGQVAPLSYTFDVTSMNVKNATAWDTPDGFVIPLTLPAGFDISNYPRFTVTASFFDGDDDPTSVGWGDALMKFIIDPTGGWEGFSNNVLHTAFNLGMPGATSNRFRTNGADWEDRWNNWWEEGLATGGLVVMSQVSYIGFIEITEIRFHQ
jgi:hypothetical protein